MLSRERENKMIKLHEYNQKIEEALNALTFDRETGEITGYEAVEAVQTDFDDKLESLACHLKEMQAEYAAIDNEEKNLKRRKEPLGKRIESLKNYMTFCMENAQKEKFSSAKCKVSFRPSQETVIDDIEFIPDEYITLKTTKSADKTAIAEAINKGIDVPGAHIVDKRNIQIK